MSSNRIPADKSDQFSSWAAPEVKSGQVILPEKLAKRGPRGELVDIDRDQIIYKSLTAAQLEEITNQAYEDIREQAYQDGLKQGHAEGYQAGLEQGKETITQQAQALSEVVASLTTHLAGQDDEVEQALVNVAICIASAILRRELTIDSAQIKEVVAEAIAALPMKASNISIHLSEQDHQLLTSLADISDEWKLQIDRTLMPGGCRITTDHTVVDFTLEDQFQQLVNAMVEKRFEALAKQAKDRAQEQKDS